MKSAIEFINILIKDNSKQIDCLEMIVEQSFSDFGDSDLIIIFNNGIEKNVIFIEAKVKTFSRQKWSIEKEYSEFIHARIENYKNITSNLFRQLGLKHVLSVESEKNLKNGIMLETKLQGTKNGSRKIGNNEIVMKAYDMIKNADKYYYIGIVPSPDSDLIKLRDNSNDEISLISWNTIIEYFRINNNLNVMKVFEYNKGQII